MAPAPALPCPCPCTPPGATGGSSRRSLCHPAPQPPGCISYSGTRPPKPFITKSSLIRVPSQAAAELLPHPCLQQAKPPFEALLRALLFCRISRELLPAPPHTACGSFPRCCRAASAPPNHGSDLHFPAAEFQANTSLFSPIRTSCLRRALCTQAEICFIILFQIAPPSSPVAPHPPEAPTPAQLRHPP